MRRVFISALATFAVAFTFADAYMCTYNGASLAGIPLTNPPLKIDQTVPIDPSLDGTRYWQFSLCTQTPYAGCSAPAGYVMQINGNLDGCDAGFVNALSDSWTFNYGGANALFGGQYVNPNDRIANVTLLCDPSATTLQPVGTVNAHSSQGGAVWAFDIVVKSNAVCGGPVPPPPPPPSPPPPLPPPTFWTSAAPPTAPPPAASYNCSFAGGTITKDVSFLSILVVGYNNPSQYYNWTFSFCKLTNNAVCSWPNNYISMVPSTWMTCSAAFNVPLDTHWGFDYGGVNAWFGAQIGSPSSIGLIANVTILCDPAATTLTAVGPVVFNAPGGDVNFFNIRLASSSVCGSTLPPAPSPPTSPPAPQGAITIEAYPALYCGGRGVTSQITPGCVANGPSGSVFSVCTSDGSTLQQFYFRNSTTCAGAPALTETTAVNQCVNSEILEGQSTQLLSCTAS